MLLGNNALLTPSAHLCSLVLVCAHLRTVCAFEAHLSVRAVCPCSLQCQIAVQCHPRPSGPPAERANIELLWLNACQLNQLAQDCGLNADTLLDIQRPFGAWSSK